MRKLVFLIIYLFVSAANAVEFISSEQCDLQTFTVNGVASDTARFDISLTQGEVGRLELPVTDSMYRGIKARLRFLELSGGKRHSNPERFLSKVKRQRGYGYNGNYVENDDLQPCSKVSYLLETCNRINENPEQYRCASACRFEFHCSNHL
jgi:hypothetical protein